MLSLLWSIEFNQQEGFLCKYYFSHFIYLVFKSLTRGSVLIYFRDSGRERGDWEREKNSSERETSNGCLLYSPCLGLKCNMSMCPDQKSNLRSFSVQDDASNNWATPAGPIFLILNLVCLAWLKQEVISIRLEYWDTLEVWEFWLLTQTTIRWSIEHRLVTVLLI